MKVGAPSNLFKAAVITCITGRPKAVLSLRVCLFYVQ